MIVILGDRYAIVKELGRGGTARVYLARHIKMNCLRAIKQIPKTEDNAHRYFIELNILKGAYIKGVPVIYDVDEDESCWYIIEEYIEGQRLDEYIASSKRTKQEIYDVICDLCTVLDNLYNTVNSTLIYNDLKMDNIIVREHELYLVDFGNCVLGGSCENDADSHWEEVKRLKCASKDSFAPEHIEGIDSLGKYTDVYGLGMIIQKIYQTRGDLLEEDYEIFREVISGCLERDTKRRIQDVKIVRRYFEINACEKNEVEYILQGKPDECNKRRIFVFGNRNKAGTTHFCMGLLKYMDDVNENFAYVENSSKDVVNNFTEKIRGSVFQDGAYVYKGCKIIPGYDGFVDWEMIDGRYIYDDWDEILKEKTYPDDIAVIIIADLKSHIWTKNGSEIRDKGDMIFKVNRVFDRKNIIYVANFSDSQGIKNYARQTGNMIYKMPLFENPFMLGREENKFYGKIRERINKIWNY